MNQRNQILIYITVSLAGLPLFGCEERKLTTYGKPTSLEKSQGEYNMHYPSYEKCENSPMFSQSELTVKACFAGGKLQMAFLKDGAWPLFGGYRVGKETISEFGKRIDSNILLLVTHKESRGIYTGRILKDDLPEHAAGSAADTDFEITSMESYFNVDLKRQCRIPGEIGKYWAVVILGKLASPVLEFEVK